MSKTTAIIGLGGGGGWVSQLLAKSDHVDEDIYLIDGDKFEENNLARQFCTAQDLGRPKVQIFDALLRPYFHKVHARPAYLAGGTEEHQALLTVQESLLLYVCVDNHPARLCCLELADKRKAANLDTVVVICGNEYESASAQAYKSIWKGTPADPRVMFPEILTDTEGNPLTPPCSGEAAASSPQLALSNMLSAVLGCWLARFYTEKAGDLVRSASATDTDALIDSFPAILSGAPGNIKTIKLGDLKQ